MYVLVFGLPSGSATLKVKVNRLLRDSGAEMVQRSVWRSDDLRCLTAAAVKVRNAGGEATILEEKVVF